MMQQAIRQIAFNGQKDGQRGTKLWGLNAIRGKIFSKLIVDLKALEKGFSDETCKMVREVLFTLLSELRRLQNQGEPGFQLFRLLAEVEEFDKLYYEWNNIEGEDEFAASKRKEILKRLQNRRYRIVKIIKNNQGEFHESIDETVIKLFFKRLSELLSVHSDKFPELNRMYKDYTLTPVSAA